MGYKVKRGKYVSMKGKEQKKFLRMRSLGAGYREVDLEKVFAGETEFTPDPKLQNIVNTDIAKNFLRSIVRQAYFTKLPRKHSLRFKELSQRLKS